MLLLRRIKTMMTMFTLMVCALYPIGWNGQRTIKSFEQMLKMASRNASYTRFQLSVELPIATTEQVIVTTEPPCPAIPPGLRGRLVVNQQKTTWSYLEKQHPHLLPGGRFQPADCMARHRVAIVIPFRDRERHLKIFLRNLHPFLQRQQLDYGIYVVELDTNVKFNRAMLMNIGFVEAAREYDYQCYVFHDVDLVPEDDRNLYTCPKLPRHMSASINTHGYRTPYDTIFGGVTALRKEHILKVNGFSNKYFGWGGEDDDLFRRVVHHNMSIIRYPNNVARYTMLKHKKERPSRIRHKLLRSGKSRYKKDGINSLKYTVIKQEERALYTWIYVGVNMTEVMGDDMVVAVPISKRKQKKDNNTQSNDDDDKHKQNSERKKNGHEHKENVKHKDLVVEVANDIDTHISKKCKQKKDNRIQKSDNNKLQKTLKRRENGPEHKENGKRKDLVMKVPNDTPSTKKQKKNNKVQKNDKIKHQKKEQNNPREQKENEKRRSVALNKRRRRVPRKWARVSWIPSDFKGKLPRHLRR